MTTATATLDTLKASLARVDDTDFQEFAIDLLDNLGYKSDRTFDLSGDVNEFIDTFEAKNPGTQTETSFVDNVKSIKIVFQITDSEIEASVSSQGLLMDQGFEFERGNARSFIFATVELKNTEYPRGKYAEFTREINKRLNVPTVVIFKTTSNLLTLAFVHRREHKRDKTRDVLGNVSLIRQIVAVDPHRAHLDILSELSLPNMLDWMRANNKPINFDGLLAAWLAKLDTQELNKSFFRELFDWFERAKCIAKFPDSEVKTLPPEEHVIRLITRLLFVWFMKEKGLVSEELFTEERIKPLINNYDPIAGDSYYRAVLQNLFFATLNTEVTKRGFSKQSNSTHRDFSLFRHRKEMRDRDALVALFSETPFINGGLFDCLDTEESTSNGGYRIDCFSDNPSHRSLLSIPNHLFFGQRNERGIIEIFNRYKFTIEENTPAEQEVALDPELLGTVFENLLAAINPETKESARKQTGSYYTPRPIVEYMVDEALVASLINKINPVDGDREFLEDRIRYLLDYNDALNDGGELFGPAETSQLVEAIAKIRILDPAGGSGAFPMGMLHKLTLALKRLDLNNFEWEKLQKQIAVDKAEEAFGILDQRERDIELTTISETFQRYRTSDFGRKLYLIQNSIFGVDIQPIACQIAKLRFFISLAIEQSTSGESNENFGIKPLPNLETRFVAADTLIELENSTQGSLGQTSEISEIQREISANRERYFHAHVRQLKLECIKRDARLRGDLAQRLEEVGMPATDAAKIARLDLYDQNAASSWFDPWYMFSVQDGFDIIIGNPPYIQLQKDGGKLGRLYQDAGFATFARTGDIYQLFYERGCKLLARRGILSYITSNSWLKAEYGKSTRRYFTEQHSPLQLLEMGKDIFENAIVDTSILILRKDQGEDVAKAVDMDRLISTEFPPDENTWEEFRPRSDQPWSILSNTEQSVMDKMQKMGTPLKEWNVKINFGIKTGYNKAFIINERTRRALIAEDPKSSEIIKPILRGRNIQRYRAQWAGYWLIATHNGYGVIPAVNVVDYPAIKSYLDRSYTQLAKRRDKGITPYHLRSCSYYDSFGEEKLLWIELAENGRFAYDDCGIYGEASTFIMTGQDIKYLCAILNAKLIRNFLQQMAPTSGMGTLRWKKVYVEEIAIPQISTIAQRPFIHLVDRILDAKSGDPDADTSELESEIELLVYQLYDLTDEEIAAIER